MLITTQLPLLEEMRRLELEVVAPETPMRLMALVLQPTLLVRIKTKQVQDPSLEKIRAAIKGGRAGEFDMDDHGVL